MTGKEEEQKYVRKALDFFRILFFEMIQNPAELFILFLFSHFFHFFHFFLLIRKKNLIPYFVMI